MSKNKEAEVNKAFDNTSIYLGEGPKNCPTCGLFLLKSCLFCESRPLPKPKKGKRQNQQDDKIDWRSLSDDEHARLQQAIDAHGIEDVARIASLQVQTVRNAVKRLPMGPVCRTALLNAARSYKRVKFFGPSR